MDIFSNIVLTTSLKVLNPDAAAPKQKPSILNGRSVTVIVLGIAYGFVLLAELASALWDSIFGSKANEEKPKKDAVVPAKPPAPNAEAPKPAAPEKTAEPKAEILLNIGSTANAPEETVFFTLGPEHKKCVTSAEGLSKKEPEPVKVDQASEKTSVPKAEILLNKDNFLQKLSSPDPLNGNIVVEGQGINPRDALKSLDPRSIRTVEMVERLASLKIEEVNINKKKINLGNVKTNLEAIKTEALENAIEEDTRTYIETLMDQTIFKIVCWKNHLERSSTPLATEPKKDSPKEAIVKKAEPTSKQQVVSKSPPPPIKKANSAPPMIFNVENFLIELGKPKFLEELSDINNLNFLNDKKVLIQGQPNGQNEAKIMEAAKKLANLNIDPTNKKINFAALRNQLRTLKEAMTANVDNDDSKLQIRSLMDQIIRKAALESIRSDIAQLECKKKKDEKKVISLDQSEEMQQSEIVGVMEKLFNLEINETNMYDFNLHALKRIVVMIRTDFPFILKPEGQKLDNLRDKSDELNQLKLQTSFITLANLLGGEGKAAGSLYLLNLEKKNGTFGEIAKPGETWASGGTMTFPAEQNCFTPDFVNMKLTMESGQLTATNYKIFSGHLTDIICNQDGSFTFNIDYKKFWTPSKMSITYSQEALKATFSAIKWE